jgi:SAM-dependent methyltransferase
MTQTNLSADGPNAGQIEYWNDEAGPRWVQAEAFLDAQIGTIGVESMDRAEITPGQNVLDVGCGCGQSTLQLAERVGTGGSVTGIDLSGPMLARARERAAGLPNVAFENADAQTANLGTERFDRVFSRFGVMFFADPKAAFANLHRACKPGGRLTFLCWQAVARNPWILVPVSAAAQHITIQLPAGPEEPGPFSFADPERVIGILSGAGWHDVAWGPLERQLVVGGGADLETAAEFLLGLGPVGRSIGEADEATVATVKRAIMDSIAPFESADGVHMDSAAWVFTANR